MQNTSMRFALGLSIAVTAALGGCDDSQSLDGIGSIEQAITDVQHTAVERQSIGNCWLYSQASWVESMSSAMTGTDLDVSQSYWTYWHWYDQIVEGGFLEEIETGGFQFIGHQIVLDRGVMRETDFVPADSEDEMSFQQSIALQAINDELKEGGRLADPTSRLDGEVVREILDEAFGLSEDVRRQLNDAFEADGAVTLRRGADVAGTNILDPATLPVRFTERVGDETVVRTRSLVDAVMSWHEVDNFFFDARDQREFLRRIQRALHDRQPVVLTWDVDFNALENDLESPRKGSFNLQTLEASGGPGRQGGHMTVLEDYAAETADFGTLEAGVPLDPNDPIDAAKLEAALEDSTRIKLLRTKNSWGSLRPDRAFAEGFPGYHDLWMDYLDGPIPFCPGVDDPDPETNCFRETTPLRTVMLPPGY